MRRSVLARIVSWQIALNAAFRYVAIGIMLVERFKSEKFGIKFGETTITSTFSDYARSGLNMSAAILFRQVFGRGNAGDNIAGNYDADVSVIRDRMVEHAKKVSNISDDDYKGLFDKINDQRHQKIAHYDGSAVFFKENGPGSFTAGMPGLLLTPSEFNQFAVLMFSMATFLESEIKTAAAAGIDETR